MKTCATAQAAREVGVSRATLQVWIKGEKFRVPKIRLVDGKAVRLWTSADLNRLRAVKLEIYRKGRGRRPKPKPKQ